MRRAGVHAAAHHETGALTVRAILASHGIHGADADSALNVIRARMVSQPDMVQHLLTAAFGQDAARVVLALLDDATRDGA